MGEARRPPSSLSRLLDLGPRQDGLQAQLPPAGTVRRPQVAAPAAGLRNALSARISVLFLCALLAACVRVNVHGDPAAAMPNTTLRIATYNTSLYDERSGGLIARLEA